MHAKVNDAPPEVRAKVRAAQNETAARAAELRAALTAPELPFDAPDHIADAGKMAEPEPAPLSDDPPAGDRMTDEDYHAHPALSAGLIKDAVSSGVHYAVWRRANPKPSTKAMDRGTRIHKALLERTRIDIDAFVPRPSGMLFSTKEGKAWKAEQEAAGREVVEAAEFAFLVGANNLVDAWLALLATTGTPWTFERPLFWTEGGVQYRCKPDALCVLPNGTPRLYSVKTTAYTVTPDQWRRQAETRFDGPSVGYDLAEYHYARGIAACTLGDPDRWPEVEIAHIVAPLEGPTVLFNAPLPAGLLHRIAPTWHGMVGELASALTEPLPSGILPLPYEPSTWAARDIPEEA